MLQVRTLIAQNKKRKSLIRRGFKEIIAHFDDFGGIFGKKEDGRFLMASCSNGSELDIAEEEWDALLRKIRSGKIK